MGQYVPDIPQVIRSTQYTERVKFTGCFIMKGDQKAKKGFTENWPFFVLEMAFWILNGLFEVKYRPAHKKLASDGKNDSFCSD